MLPKINTVVYATGLGPGAPYVFRYAMTIARQHQAKIIVVHGMEPLTPFGQSLVEHYISHDTTEEMHQKARESVMTRLKGRLEKLCKRECDGAENCENLVGAIRVIEGQPGQVVLDVAKESDADLIVMGAHRHTVFNDLLGSTTHRVLNGSKVPVLVVKIPKEAHEDLD